MSNNSLVAQHNDALPAHVGQLLQAAGMNYEPAAFADMTIEQHAEQGIKGWQASTLAAVYSGMHFAAIQSLGDRLLSDEAEKRGISRRSIYNMINVYKLFIRCPEQCVQSIAHLGITKVIELIHLNESDLEQLAEGQEVYGITLETAQTYSVRELKAVLQSQRAEVKNLKQRILDAERKLDTEAQKTSELFAENQALKKMTPERRSFQALRKQTFEDMEALQGIVVRARKTLELSQNFQNEVAAEAKEAVIFPLMHLLSVMHGNSRLLVDDLVLAWQLDPSIPVNPPHPDSMTHEERWAAQQSAKYQDALTKMYFSDPRKGKKS